MSKYEVKIKVWFINKSFEIEMTNEEKEIVDRVLKRLNWVNIEITKI